MQLDLAPPQEILVYAPIKPPLGKNTVFEVERYSFLKSSDHPYHDFYRKKRDAYIAQCQDGMIHFRLPKFDDLKHPPLFRNPPPDITPIQLGLVKVIHCSVCGALRDTILARFDRHAFLIKASPCVLPYADKALGEFFRYLRLEKLHENVIDLHALAYGLDCMDADAPPPLMMLHPNDQDEDDDIQPKEQTQETTLLKVQALARPERGTYECRKNGVVGKLATTLMCGLHPCKTITPYEANQRSI
ncbi:hypothetical protein YC2023_017359 [Brassica napus]